MSVPDSKSDIAPRGGSASQSATPAGVGNRRPPPRRAPNPDSATSPVDAAPALPQRADPDPAEPDGSGASLSSFKLRNVPSWLISAVFHLIALIVLGLLTFSVAQKTPEKLLLAAVETNDEEQLVEFVLEAEEVENLEQQEHQALAAPDDPGAINFGQLASDLEIAATAEVGVAAPSETDVEIGALFGAEGQGFAKAGLGAGGAEFFGVKSSGNRFVFVVDGSSSMGRAKKWDECRKELMKAVGKLSARQQFYVFLFSRNSHRMFGKEEVKHLVRATPENIEKLRHWLYYDYQLQGGTVPIDGLREALEQLKPDAIYLLSDGQFTDQGRSEKYLLNFARNKNDRVMIETGDRYRIYVHTIAFHSRRGEVVLKGIADAFKATFRFVPAGG